MLFNEYYEKLVTLNLKRDNPNKKQFFVMGSEDFLTNVAFNRGGVLDESPFIIPFNDESKTKLFDIDKQTREDISSLFGINTELEWQCNTIANILFENILKRLYLVMHDTHCGSLDLDFYNLFTIGLSTKNDKNAEKAGNINIFFKNSETFNNIISNTQLFNKNPRNIFDFQYSKYGDLYKLIDINTQVELNLRYGIIISDNWVSTAITYIFMKNIYNNIIRNVIDGNKTSFINFNDNIEFHAVIDRGELIGSLRPGMNAKLIVKSDDLTEMDDE